MAPRPLDRSFFATAVIVQRVADDGVLRKKKKAKLQFADIMQSIISELVQQPKVAPEVIIVPRAGTPHIGEVAFTA